MRIPATLKKIRNRATRNKGMDNPDQFGPKRSKSAPFYFQDFNTEDLELLTNGFSSPTRFKGNRYSCATPDSAVSTPGLTRRERGAMAIPCVRKLANQPLGRSEPMISLGSSPPEPIRQTSLGVIASKRLRRADRPMTANPFDESRGRSSPGWGRNSPSCCPADDCVLCTLVKPEFRGRHVPRINNPSFVRNFD